MSYRAIVTVCALLALGTAACDPFEENKGGAPAVIGAQITGFDQDAFDNSDFAAAYPNTQAVAGATAGSWAINTNSPDQKVVQLFMNKLLSGSTIQTSPTDCTPAGNWVQVTPSTGCPWYSCYQPSSPTKAQGATVLLFQACGPVTANDGAFDVAESLPVGTFHITNAPNTIRDNQGNPVPIDVTITVAAPPPA